MRWMTTMAALAVVGFGAGCQDVSISAQQGELVITPAAVDFGVVVTGAQESQVLTLTNGGQATVNITAVAVEGDENFEVLEGFTGELGRGEAVELTVGYGSTVEDDNIAQLVITSDAVNERLEQMMWGSARDPGLFVYPAFLDFGITEVGTPETLELYVANDGLVDVTVEAADVSPPGSPFDAVPDPALGGGFPVVVAAGAEGALLVTFDPVDITPQAGTLVLATNDVNHPTLEVPLYGNDCDATFHPDFDGDGDGTAACAGDCDDTDPASHPGAGEVCDGADNDCDGTVDEGTECYDDDGDGFAEIDGDCNDGDDAVGPLEEEIVDGIDNDCDGLVDEDPLADDDDGDGYAELGGDCDDADPDTYPGAPEICDGVDNDCDPGTPVDIGTECYDDDGDGWTEDDGDCNDADEGVYPGAPDSGPGVDWDCDGLVDGMDGDGDGYTAAGGDCDDADPAIGPAAPEIADGVDNDCDGIVDEGTEAYDDDGDGVNELQGDCNDGDPAVYPGNTEIADGVDNNCNGFVDEDTPNFDDDGDGWTETGGDCDDTNPWVNPGAWDNSVNGIDDDCDGVDGQ